MRKGNARKNNTNQLSFPLCLSPRFEPPHGESSLAKRALIFCGLGVSHPPHGAQKGRQSTTAPPRLVGSCPACFLVYSSIPPQILSFGQIAAFRNVNATAIQRMARGMQARARFRRRRAQAMVKRQMLFFLTRAFVASAKVARRIREEMRKKNVRRVS